MKRKFQQVEDTFEDLDESLTRVTSTFPSRRDNVLELSLISESGVLICIHMYKYIGIYKQ
jgi:hypothetical protein